MASSSLIRRAEALIDVVNRAVHSCLLNRRACDVKVVLNKEGNDLLRDDMLEQSSMLATSLVV